MGIPAGRGDDLLIRCAPHASTPSRLSTIFIPSSSGWQNRPVVRQSARPESLHSTVTPLSRRRGTGVRVDQVVVALAVHHVVALVVAAGHKAISLMLMAPSSMESEVYTSEELHGFSTPPVHWLPSGFTPMARRLPPTLTRALVRRGPRQPDTPFPRRSPCPRCPHPAAFPGRPDKRSWHPRR